MVAHQHHHAAHHLDRVADEHDVALRIGVGDRNVAETLRGLTLATPRAALPPLAPGEYYIADYLGRAVVDETGAAVGTVKSIENFGASDILDIVLAGGGSVMVPFVADVVREEPDRLIVDRAWLL